MKKNSMKGAQSVLNEDYGEQKPFSHDRLVECWRQVFSSDSVRDDRPMAPVMGPCYDLEAPITCGEVKIPFEGSEGCCSRAGWNEEELSRRD